MTASNDSTAVPVVSGNAALDANLDRPPVADPIQDGAKVTNVTASLAPDNMTAILDLGKKGYVIAQPFAVAVGDSVPTHSVKGNDGKVRDDVVAIYVEEHWVTARIEPSLS